MLCPDSPLHNFDAQCDSCSNCERYYDCLEKDQKNYYKTSEEKKNKCPYYPNVFFTKGRCKVCQEYNHCLKRFYSEESDIKKNKNSITQEELDNFRVDLDYIIYIDELIRKFEEIK